MEPEQIPEQGVSYSRALEMFSSVLEKLFRGWEAQRELDQRKLVH